MSFGIILLTVVFFSSIALFLFITACVILPCDSGYLYRKINSVVKSLEVDSFDSTEGHIKPKSKSVFGGWITVVILFVFINASTLMIIELLDPFLTQSTITVDQFATKQPGFKMQYNVIRSGCDFTHCNEQYYTGDSRVVATKLAAPENSTKYFVDIETELYTDDFDYSLYLDHCCATIEIRPVPQLQVEDAFQFTPAFDSNGLSGKQFAFCTNMCRQSTCCIFGN